MIRHVAVDATRPSFNHSVWSAPSIVLAGFHGARSDELLKMLPTSSVRKLRTSSMNSSNRSPHANEPWSRSGSPGSRRTGIRSKNVSIAPDASGPSSHGPSRPSWLSGTHTNGAAACIACRSGSLR